MFSTPYFPSLIGEFSPKLSDKNRFIGKADLLTGRVFLKHFLLCFELLDSSHQALVTNRALPTLSEGGLFLGGVHFLLRSRAGSGSFRFAGAAAVLTVAACLFSFSSSHFGAFPFFSCSLMTQWKCPP